MPKLKSLGKLGHLGSLGGLGSFSPGLKAYTAAEEKARKKREAEAKAAIERGLKPRTE